MGLWTRKSVADLEASSPRLAPHLTLPSLILLGVGGTIGAGIFVLTGTAAAQYAGPAIALSFVIAGLACLCAGLCYAELASMIPVAGSAYTYAYVTLGEGPAWAIGWTLLLEYLFATSTVAVGWSGYFCAAAAEAGAPLPSLFSGPPLAFAHGAWRATGAWLNLPAVGVILAVSALLSSGIRGSARANNIVVALKLIVVFLVIGAGSAHLHPANWRPFVPPNQGAFGAFGWSGVVRAAGVVFFAYIGFDMVSSSAQEAVRPQRDIPISLLTSLAICTVLYVAMSLVLTGLAPYSTLNVPHPVYVALLQGGPALAWLRPLVSLGVIIGLCSPILICLYGQSRLFYAMGRDGLIPPLFARVSPRSSTPVVGTWVAGVFAAAIAGLLPIDILGELVSIGTLLAFIVVSVGVLVLRRRHPEWPRPFRTPWVWFSGPLAIVICLYLMISLPAPTWGRLAVWLLGGAIIYAGYGRHRSHAALAAAAVSPQTMSRGGRLGH